MNCRNKVDYGHNSLYSITGDLSIGFWITLPSNAQGSIIGYAYNSAAADTPYYLQVEGSSGAWSIRYLHDYGTASAEDHTFATALRNDIWYYIGITRDATARTVKLYIGDGDSLDLFDTFSYTNNAGGSTADSRMMVGNINGPSGGSVTANNLIGTVEEHYIWSRALSPAEHEAAMNGNPSLTSLVLGSRMGDNPEVDFSGNGGSGVVTGTTLAQGHN